MAEVNQQFINEIANNMLKPTIVDTFTYDGMYDVYVDEEYSTSVAAKYTLKFIGYALPSCTGMSDPKWLIQLNVKVDITGDLTGTAEESDESGDGYLPIPISPSFKQRSIIGFANGVRDFDQRWTDRLKLAYSVAKGSSPFYKDGCLTNEIFEFGNEPGYSPLDNSNKQSNT